MTLADRERLAEELEEHEPVIAYTLRSGRELVRQERAFVNGWCHGCLDNAGSSSSDFIRFVHRVLEEVKRDAG